MARSMFDTAQNRISYGDLLQPEVGYVLDFAVCMTYSLDLEALLGVPISLGLLDEMDTSMRESPFYMLEAIRKSSNDIAIFCNAGGISLPRKIQSIFSLLENSVFEIKLPNKQNFHPKLWIAKYSNSNGESYIRLIILSRNLTFDNSIDMVVSLTGSIGRKKRNRNKPLSDMLAFVNEFSSIEKKKRIIELAESVMYVNEFDIEAPFDDYEFLPLGIGDYNKEKTSLFEKINEVFVVSPFLSNDIIDELTNISGRKALITRKTSITPHILNCFNDVYITKEVLTDNEFGIKQDVHAKVYYTAGRNGNFLYLGSANASHNAFYNNVEFLIKLKYAPYYISYDKIIEDFIPEDNCPFEKITVAPDMLQSDDKALDKVFKDVIWGIKGAKVICEDKSYSIEVYSQKVNTDKTVRIAPLQKEYAFVPLEKTTRLDNMLLRELSEFYVLEIDEAKIVIKIPTRNIPQNRDDSIYNSIINSKGAFLSYVSFMLSDNYAESSYEQELYLKVFNKDEIAGQDFSYAVYEKMLKAAYESPNRLKELGSVITKLDKEVVPEEFYQMYQQFELAVRRQKK